MAPQGDKNVIKSKCHLETRDGKQKMFSFRWLLRKSKSSRSAKEMTQAEKVLPSTVPSSKSCDTGLTALEPVDRCPTFLLWKLLPPATKTLGPSRSNNVSVMPEKLPFKTSFSCSDVYSMVPSLSILNSAESTQDLYPSSKNTNSRMKYPSYSWYRLHKSNAALSNVDASTKSPAEEYSPNPCHNVLCKLCLMMVPASSIYTLHDCKCVFCVSCLQQYLTINIKDGNVTVTCPDADCGADGKVLVSEVKEIAGDDAYFMFERYKLNLDVELDPSRVWCPSAGCETICTFQPASSPDVGVSVLCLNCRTRFCSVCKLGWHGSTSCEDARRAFNDEIELSISDDESSIKRCPNCRIPIEKDDGCAQMMCYRCKHVFCWHCLASLDDDFLLRHYDKGPCRNKLGHSRASMVWHRTQVVGIFAGFSFLLLMASPFLLLAAPCLLCCRCKYKFSYKEATPL